MVRDKISNNEIRLTTGMKTLELFSGRQSYNGWGSRHVDHGLYTAAEYIATCIDMPLQKSDK